MAEIEAIFDACLFKLEMGATIEESLQGHAAEQAEIVPLLQVAAALRSLAAPAPARSEKARQATRTDFLAAAGVVRDATTRRRRGCSGGKSGFARRRCNGR